MKSTYFLLLILLPFLGYSGLPFQVQLAESQKLESTYSIAMNGNKSMHLLLIKNTENKQGIYRVFISEASQPIHELEPVLFDDLPGILSYHGKDDMITLVAYSDKRKHVTIVDIDSKTGQHSTQKLEDIDDPEFSLHDSQKSVIINMSSNAKEFQVLNIQNTKQYKKDDVTITDEKVLADFKPLMKNYPQVINQNEYVKNGSIMDSRIYLSDNFIYFTSDSHAYETKLFAMDLSNPANIKAAYYYADKTTSSEKNTYIFQDHLYMIGIGKEDVVFKAIDIQKRAEVKQLSLVKDVFGNKLTDMGQLYLSEGKKISLRATVTANKTTANGLRFRLDRVNKTSYQYHYDWWFMHSFMVQQQMLMIQQQTMNSIPRGPAEPLYFEYASVSEFKPASIEFVLDSTLNLTQDIARNLFSDIDKDKYIEEFKDKPNYKKFTAAFQDQEMHYVYQNNKSKIIYFESKPL